MNNQYHMIKDLIEKLRMLDFDDNGIIDECEKHLRGEVGKLHIFKIERFKHIYHTTCNREEFEMACNLLKDICCTTIESSYEIESIIRYYKQAIYHIDEINRYPSPK